jgi:hypothetical protein
MGERVNGSEACERKGLGFAIYAPSLDACRARRPIGPLLLSRQMLRVCQTQSDRERAPLQYPGSSSTNNKTCRFHVAGRFVQQPRRDFPRSTHFTLSYKQHTRTRYKSGDARQTPATHARGCRDLFQAIFPLGGSHLGTCAVAEGSIRLNHRDRGFQSWLKPTLARCANSNTIKDSAASVGATVADQATNLKDDGLRMVRRLPRLRTRPTVRLRPHEGQPTPSRTPQWTRQGQ